MGEYSKFIAPERRSIPTPRLMVENGKKTSSTACSAWARIKTFYCN